MIDGADRAGHLAGRGADLGRFGDQRFKNTADARFEHAGNAAELAQTNRLLRFEMDRDREIHVERGSLGDGAHDEPKLRPLAFEVAREMLADLGEHGGARRDVEAHIDAYPLMLLDIGDGAAVIFLIEAPREQTPEMIFLRRLEAQDVVLRLGEAFDLGSLLRDPADFLEDQRHHLAQFRRDQREARAILVINAVEVQS